MRARLLGTHGPTRRAARSGDVRLATGWATMFEALHRGDTTLFVSGAGAADGIVLACVKGTNTEVVASEPMDRTAVAKWQSNPAAL